MSELKSVLKSAISVKIRVLFFLFFKVNNISLFISHYLELQKIRSFSMKQHHAKNQ